MIYSGNSAVFTGMLTNLSTHEPDIYAVKVNLDGSLPWTNSRTNLSNNGHVYLKPALIVSDENGGACVFWSDRRTQVNYLDIYGQRVSSNGGLQWGSSTGIMMSEGSPGQYVHNLSNLAIAEGMNIFNTKFLLPWHNYSTSGLYFHPRNISDGSVLDDIFENPALVSSTAAEGDYSTSAFMDDYSNSAIVLYRSSGDLYARAYWISEPFEPRDRKMNGNLDLLVTPNPCNPVAQITYSLPKAGYISIEVFNTLGQTIATLKNNEYEEPGKHTVVFNGNQYSSGVYFIQVYYEGNWIHSKLILLK